MLPPVRGYMPRMPSDLGDGLAFAVLFLGGVLGLLFLLAWLEAPSQVRRRASASAKRWLAIGSSSAVSGRHRGAAQPWVLRRSPSATSEATTRRAASTRSA